MDYRDGVLPFIHRKKVANSVTFFGKSNQKTLSSTEPVHCFHLSENVAKTLFLQIMGRL